MSEVLFSKPILAVVKAALAELYTHTEMTNLFERYSFGPSLSQDFSNKLKRASSYLDHQNWADGNKTKDLLNLLTDVYLNGQHFLKLAEQYGEGHSNAITLFCRLHRTLSDSGISWNGSGFDVIQSSKFDLVKADDFLDLKTVHLEVRRAKENIEKDPSDAITAAENILVSTCKAILTKHSVEWRKAASPQELVNEVMKLIEVLPSSVSNGAIAKEGIRKIVRSMAAASQGISELRNAFGDSHGKEPSFSGLHPKHARLLTGFAETLSVFFVECHRDGEPK